MTSPITTFEVLTLFPEAITAFASAGLLGRAVDRGLVELHCTQIRDFATDRHRTVDDAPFVAQDVEARDGALTFRTNVDEEVTAGPDHPIRVERDPATGEPSPYLLVRANLEALIDRKTFYRLVDMGEVRPHEGADWFGVTSQGVFFPIIPAAELPD